MAKDEERKLARILFVEQGASRKDIAARLGVRDKTVGDWASKGEWDAARTAWLTRTDNVVVTLKGLIQAYSDRLTEIEQHGGDPKEKGRLVDALVKTAKTLETVRSENDITLSARLRVMEWVFAELQKTDPDTHRKLVDFQERLLDEAVRMHA